MRLLTLHRPALFALALCCSVSTTHAAPHKTRPLTSKLIHTTDNRVTVFYEFKTKDGKYHKLASVSKAVIVKIVQPSQPHMP